MKTSADDPHDETSRSAEGAPRAGTAPAADASSAPTRPPPPLYPPPSYPEPRIAVMTAPIIVIEELAPETPRVPPSASMVRLATPAHAMPPVPSRSPVHAGAARVAASPLHERADQSARSSLEAIIMTPGPMIPATLPPAPVRSGGSKWLFVAPCLAVAVGALLGFGFAQRAALPAPRETSARMPTFGLARSIVFVRESTFADPVVPPTMGTIVTRGAELGHRVYVDGRVVGTSGESFTVPCGRHEVRVGTTGRARVMDVACGASVDVAR